MKLSLSSVCSFLSHNGMLSTVGSQSLNERNTLRIRFRFSPSLPRPLGFVNAQQCPLQRLPVLAPRALALFRVDVLRTLDGEGVRRSSSFDDEGGVGALEDGRFRGGRGGRRGEDLVEKSVEALEWEAKSV
jgi:hypothetical protein